LSIARQMKAYEDIKYNEWRINIENTLPEILKTNLLVKEAGDKNLVLPLNVDPETGNLFFLLNNFFSSVAVYQHSFQT
jgi:hypothetical protein